MALRQASSNAVVRNLSLPAFANDIRCRTSRIFSPSTISGDGVRNHGTSNHKTYNSPFQDIFDRINEGKTFLGSSKIRAPKAKFLESGVPVNALTFTTNSYGRLLEEPFVEPNEHKVSIQVHSKHIPLNEVERTVLKEIVGTRFNEERGILQLSSVQFGSRIENKRHIITMLNRIVESSRELAKTLDGSSKTEEDTSS